MSSPKQKKRKPKKQKRSPKGFIFRLLFSIALLLSMGLFILILLIRLGFFGELPSYIELKQIKNNTATSIYSVDDKLIGRYYFENRTNAKIDEIPEYLIHALVATEDVRFFEHKGLDYRSMMRVLVKTIILQNRSAGGGSTLSQQLAKNLFPRKDLGVLSMPVAKISEIMVARRIEKLYTKEDILQLYLNTVPFGENTFGIETASLTFFNKKPKALSIEESAVLVGLLKANTGYNPRLYKDAAFKRRNIVLSQMCKYGYISPQELDSLKKIPIKLKYNKISRTNGLAPYFREYVRKNVMDILKDVKRADGSKPNLYTDGLKIYTTLNASLQTYLESAVKQHMSRLQKIFDQQWKGSEPWKKNPKIAMLQIKQSGIYKSLIKKGLSTEEAIEAMKEPRKTRIFTWEGMKDTLMSPLDVILHHFKMLQTGALVMNPQSGDIVAWVGGINYNFYEYDHVTAKRQTGSIIKPIVYASALEKGIKPCDFFQNDSVSYEEYDNWTPSNSGNGYGGYYSVKGALANSVNTISVKLLMEAGIDSTVALAHKMGINSSLPNYPSMALGTGEVSLYEMVKAYAVFLNKGYTIEPRIIRRIEDGNGNILYSDKKHQPQENVLSEETTQQIIAMLQGVVDRGTAKGLRSVWQFENEMAGKTGTTQNNVDAWFMGLTPNLITGVWVGGDNPTVRFKTTTYGQGAYAALPVVGHFLNKVYHDSKYAYLKSKSFQVPDTIYTQLNCNDFEQEQKQEQEQEQEQEIKIKDRIKKKNEGIGDFIKRLFKRKKKPKSRNN